MVTFKYVLIVLHADNQGEGGTFSCYSLLTRFVRHQSGIIQVGMKQSLSWNMYSNYSY